MDDYGNEVPCEAKELHLINGEYAYLLFLDGKLVISVDDSGSVENILSALAAELGWKFGSLWTPDADEWEDIESLDDLPYDVVADFE